MLTSVICIDLMQLLEFKIPIKLKHKKLNIQYQAMQGKKQSTVFKFVLSNEDTMRNLDQLKLDNYQRFTNTCFWGKQIQDLAKANDHQKLGQFVDKHMFDIPYMKFQIQDAFVSAFNLKNLETVEYFLKNGIEIQELVEDSVVSTCFGLEYDAKNPPIEMLRLILEYGADPRHAEDRDSQTAMHLACKHNCLEIVKLLIQYKADINAVDDFKKTPLNYAIQNGFQQITKLLKSLQASENWRT